MMILLRYYYLMLKNPETFNDDNKVVLDNVENPETFNDDIIVVIFDNGVKPETFNDDTNETLLFNVVNPLTFNDVYNNVSPLTFKANIPGLVVFIPKPAEVIICLSEPFILYIIFPELLPKEGSPPLSCLISTSLFTLEFELPHVFKSIAVLAPFFHIRL